MNYCFEKTLIINTFKIKIKKGGGALGLIGSHLKSKE